MCFCFYCPQSSCRKIMFSQASAILFTGGVADTPPGRHPPGQTPPPWADTPSLGRHPLPGQTPHLDRYPLPGRHPPLRWLLQRTVRILLECILVVCFIFRCCRQNVSAIFKFSRCQIWLTSTKAVQLKN